MNHLIWPVSLVGILSTAVVCGTDMFFLTVGRPALRLASPSAGTEVMGFVHIFGDARMPIWGGLAILVELLAGTLHQEWTSRVPFRLALYADPVRRYLQSFVKASQSASNRSGKNGRKARQCSKAAGVVGSISDGPYSAARCVPARPVPSIASHFGVNARVCSPFKSEEKARADNCGFMACSPMCGLFPTL
jgi:hypothetical protein